MTASCTSGSATASTACIAMNGIVQVVLGRVRQCSHTASNCQRASDRRATKRMSSRRSNTVHTTLDGSLAHARGARLPRPTQDEDCAIVRVSSPRSVLEPLATCPPVMPVPTPPIVAATPMRDGGKVRDDSTSCADRLSAVWACSARRHSASRSCIPSTAAANAPPARGAFRVSRRLASEPPSLTKLAPTSAWFARYRSRAIRCGFSLQNPECKR